MTIEAVREPLLQRTGTPLLSVVVPTRNEAHNVGPLLQRLSHALDGQEFESIFVDDSDDGTEALLADLAATEYEHLHVIHRLAGGRVDGLSGAVLEGLHVARGRFVAVIDADLQHPPELLPRMLEELSVHNADIVIASRYAGDGSADGLADPVRRFVSRATAIGTRLLFAERLAGVRDPASGYFVLRRSLLEGAELRPLGYKILLEVLIRTSWRRVREVPYRFSEREADTSKADFRQGLVFLRHCTRLLREVPMAGLVWKAAGVIIAGLLVTGLLGRSNAS